MISPRIDDPPEQSPAEPRLLVELPSRTGVFFGNLRDRLFPRRLPEMQMQSAPGPFWPDVFVKRGIPWFSLLESVAYHVIFFALILGLNRALELRPHVELKPAFDRSQVVSYERTEFLPPIDTRTEPAPAPQKADPEIARQPIISVPPEADNRSQTIVTPPNVKLKHDVAMPNIVAWSDKATKPELWIPPVPVTPAAEITRIAPQMQSAIVSPPADPEHAASRRDSPALQASVVAPPPELRPSREAVSFQAPEPAVVAPPSTVDGAARRPLGELNIGPSAVIAPAPQLPVGEQRAVLGGRASAAAGIAPKVVAPPPSVGGVGSSGAPGRIIALSLHPDASAPPIPPAGNRRGTFAASPEGRAGASGAPGSANGTASGAGGYGNGTGPGTGSGRKGQSDLPSGLYVRNAAAPAKASSVAGDPAGKAAPANPPVVATVRPPRVSTTPARPASAESAAKLTEAERAVFGIRRIYSVTLNMPNLNSAGGSWVIRFAEFSRDDKDSAAGDLSQPLATRKVDPAYPIQLMRENVAGTVILYAVIHADGTVGNVRVLRGVDERLDRYASEAVAQWKFDPATKNGSPVDVEATFQIPFRPARVGTNF